jgi:DNA-3-methyladenine glycosylase I
MNKQRCHWCGTDPLYTAYHDQEWGVPVFDERKLFEFLMLEGMQAGLSWITILRKRAYMREVFGEFNPTEIVKFKSKKIKTLMNDPGIIRSERKIKAVICNAKAYLALQDKGESLCDFLWQFTEGQVITNQWKETEAIPTATTESKAMAKALKSAGFSFVGETICYALMQAIGIVNDHVVSCYRHKEIAISIE